jgi:hypothetical protein
MRVIIVESVKASPKLLNVATISAPSETNHAGDFTRTKPVNEIRASSHFSSAASQLN